MDGTLIGRDEQLPEGISDWIAKLKEHNVMFTVATGRSEAFMEPLIKRMGISLPYAASNGAAIVRAGSTLRRRQFPVSHIRGILKKAQEMGLSLLFTSNGIDRVIEITPWLIKEAAKHGITYRPEPFSEREWNEYRIEKVLIMDDIRDGRISIIEELCKDSGDAGFHYVRYRNKAIELMERTANKADAVRRIVEILNVAMPEVLVVGDDDNDLQMFQLGAISAAVGNASSNVLPFVEYHCVGTQFDGVKEAVLKYCGV